jgi:hypothetical protein
MSEVNIYCDQSWHNKLYTPTEYLLQHNAHLLYVEVLMLSMLDIDYDLSCFAV